jgi:hypothetical protein
MLEPLVSTAFRTGYSYLIKYRRYGTRIPSHATEGCDLGRESIWQLQDKQSMLSSGSTRG